MRQIIVSAREGDTEALMRRARDCGAIDISVHRDLARAGRITMSLLVGRQERQEILDALQAGLADDDDWRITLLPVETSVPFPETEEDADEDAEAPGGNGQSTPARRSTTRSGNRPAPTGTTRFSSRSRPLWPPSA
ncbi:MAG: hypothetical protein RI571_11860 [Roseovarius sp.]|nr:hypothetical protein [Roseovarius sp.]